MLAPQSRSGQIALCSLFGVVVLVPTLFWPAGTALNTRLNENRRKAEIRLDVSGWAGMLDTVSQLRNAYNDRFPFRDAAIQADAFLKLSVFGNRWTDRVLVGTDNWLFLRRTSNGLPVTLPTAGFSDPELEAWVSMLETRSRVLQARGCHHVLIIAPEKAAVYPDKRPSDFAVCRPDTRVDQLLSFLKRRGSVDFIDLRPVLRSARQQDPELYYRTDTHWNAIGGWYASQAIAGHLGLTFPCADRMSCVVKEVARDYHGDLHRLLAAPALPGESRISCVPITGFHWTRSLLEGQGQTPGPDYSMPFVTESPSGGPTAVIFRDSFTLELQPFLSDCFRRGVWIWNYVQDLNVIQSEDPELVLDIFVERQLQTDPPLAFRDPVPDQEPNTRISQRNH